MVPITCLGAYTRQLYAVVNRKTGCVMQVELAQTGCASMNAMVNRKTESVMHVELAQTGYAYMKLDYNGEGVCVHEA